MVWSYATGVSTNSHALTSYNRYTKVTDARDVGE